MNSYDVFKTVWDSTESHVESSIYCSVSDSVWDYVGRTVRLDYVGRTGRHFISRSILDSAREYFKTKQ
jgi:hypothetical protein